MRAETITLVLAAGLLPAAVFGAVAGIVENTAIRVTVLPDGGFSIAEKGSGRVWRSRAPQSAPLRFRPVKAAGRVLEASAEFEGTPWRVRFEAPAGEPELMVTLSAPARAPLSREVRYPFAVTAPGPGYRAVVPHKTGLMFAPEDVRPGVAGQYGCFTPSGLSMPWFGLTNLSRGLVVLIETPADAGLDLQFSDGAFAPGIYWLPVKEKAGYARRIRCRLIRGGYVEMSKFYRAALKARGEFVTLREKEQINPNVAKLIGAADFHMRGGDSDQVEAVSFLESLGVKRMLLNTMASPKTIAWMKERGHLVGSYRVYTDIHPRQPNLREALARGFPGDAYTQKSGSPVRGFGYSDKNQTTYRCPLLQIPLMQDLVPPLIRQNGYEALFLDVVTADLPRECYSPAHPIDRREDLLWRTNVLRYAAALDLVVGSEDGNSWAAPYLHYFEGMTMPRRFGSIRGLFGTWPQPFDLSDEYMAIDLNERVRVPLWDLVFHDSVVSTWRWNLTADRYSDSKWWLKQDLLKMIAGNMPIHIVDRKYLEKVGPGIAAGYRRCSEWNARTGWDELVDHRALTADRSVQESRFSSGWAVMVNYSGRAHSSLAPMSYRTYRWNEVKP